MEPTPSDAATPRARAHPDPLGLLRACERAALEREGIAMFVGIHDARASASRNAAGAASAAGSSAPEDPDADRLRRLYEQYAAGLAPGRDERRPSPDPTGGAWSLIEVLVVLSEHHLRAPIGLAHPASLG